MCRQTQCASREQADRGCHTPQDSSHPVVGGVNTSHTTTLIAVYQYIHAITSRDDLQNSKFLPAGLQLCLLLVASRASSRRATCFRRTLIPRAKGCVFAIFVLISLRKVPTPRSTLSSLSTNPLSKALSLLNTQEMQYQNVSRSINIYILQCNTTTVHAHTTTKSR